MIKYLIPALLFLSFSFFLFLIDKRMYIKREEEAPKTGCQNSYMISTFFLTY